MSRTDDWVLTTDESGYTRRFGVDDLPVSIGGGADDDIRLARVTGSLQIGVLDDVFFALPSRHAENVRVNGERVRGSARLADGDVVALDSARLTCRLAGGRLTLAIQAEVTAGDTAPPDFDELAQSVDEGEVSIQPIAFRPGGATGGPRRRRPSTATIVVTAAFAVLAVLGWFAFTAKSVALEFSPEPESVELPDTLFQFQLGGRYMLRRGTHSVSAELDGYYPLETQITVGRSSEQRFELELTKLPGLVTLDTEPAARAEVRLDGEPLGTTPMEDVEIRPGLHRLEFTAERFLPEVRELDVEGGHVRQSLTAELTPNWAPVSVTSEPAGAEILVDGEPAAETPADVEIEAGRREIELRLPGYNAWRETILVNADEPHELPRVELEPADGRVELVSTPGEAAVSLNGQFAGRTPLTLSLEPGRAHEIVVSRPGYTPVRRELNGAADSGRRLEIELEGEYGQVLVETEPPGAAVLVDGEPAGAVTPAELRLMAVEHEIEVDLEGYASRAEALTPRPGYTQTLSFELERLDDTTGGGYPRTITTSQGHELELVPAGRFTMGASRSEQGRRSNETLKSVRLSKAFYIGAREVTNAEFREFFPDHDSGDYRGESLDGDDQPVVSVTWAEAAQYLNALSVDEGLQPVYVDEDGEWVAQPSRNGYRLPTEAEWAYAARAAGRDEPLRFPWGEALPAPDRSGNYADLAASDVLPNTLVAYNDGFPVTAPPGSFEPNAIGLYDIGGNVAEWVQDYYGIEVEPGAGEAVDPLGPESGRFHVVRGSSWRSLSVAQLRLAYRDYSGQERDDLGFRIARNLE